MTRVSALVLLLVATAAVFFLLPVTGSGDADTCSAGAASPVLVQQSPSLSVLSVNLAHGRGDGLNQMLQRSATTRRNLDESIEFLNRIDADIIALQEADGPSSWSGGFDHVEYVASGAGYPCILHGLHAQTRLYSFGTALVSRQPLASSLVHNFKPTPPTTTKGFVLGSLSWNPGGAMAMPYLVTMVSLHLDFSRRSVRDSQLAELSTVLSGIETPLIVMGDFNADWGDSAGSLQRFASELGLHAYQPEAPGFGTYKDGDKRLDWILLSKELDFDHYEVLTDVVSDHLPVFAKIAPAGK